MTVNEFSLLKNLSAPQVTALREAGLISMDLPADQAGRARLIQGLKSKGIPLSQLAHLTIPPAATFVVYDHSDRRIDTFADPGRALARAAACRGACTVALVGQEPATGRPTSSTTVTS
jgi:hypothetical protein